MGIKQFIDIKKLSGLVKISAIKNLNIPEHIATYRWHIAVALALLLFIITLSATLGQYGGTNEEVIASGKRFIITLPEGKISGRIKQVEELAAPESSETEPSPEQAPADEEKAVEFTGVGEILDKRPRVAIILTGLGLSKTSTEQALTLPKEITLSFSPYASTLDEWMHKAAEKEFTLFIDLPMEPSDYPISDPGPSALLTQASVDQNLAQLNSVVSVTKGYSGVLGALDEQFTFSMDGIIPVLNALKEKQLLFVYTNKPRNFFLPQTAKSMALPVMTHDIVLDQNLSEQALNNKFEEIEVVAREKGYAIVIGRPYPTTISKIDRWVKLLNEKGLVLVPISSIISYKK